MIKRYQEIYPSSNVSPDVIAAYGWRFIEEIPSRPNDQGQPVPTLEASSYLRNLRGVIDEQPSLRLATDEGVIIIEDFAVAKLPEGTTHQLGFFALMTAETNK